ncbi:VOC family protein [Promicromonospora sukumoe]|uniref:VOC family protein n=1 Tax=Promicromonospora sukumoe TaxID=88382 RepID=UPI000380B292|nr:VOC family protein [Promicromonospora sukumoe]
MTKIIDSVMSRIEVADLDAALPAYCTLAGTQEVRRLEFPQFRMAIVGTFMLIEGTPEQLAPFRRAATLMARDHDAAVAALTDTGGRVLDGPTPSAGGVRSIVADRDGNTFEVFTPQPV